MPPFTLAQTGERKVQVTMAEFYEAVGRAHTAWGMLEEKLLDVFSRTVVCSIAGSMLRSPDAIWTMGTIFYGSTNLRGRLAVMTAIIERSVKDEALQAEWQSASNRVLKLYKRRNIMAHGMVYGGSDGLASSVAYPVLSEADGHLDYRAVQEAEKSFLDLAGRLEALAIAINRYFVPAS